MFLKESDYLNIAGKDGLKIFEQSDEEIRKRAEDYAIAEVKGYLRSRYGVDKIFDARDAERSDDVVMRTVDVSLYHMVCALPQRMGYEIREIRYKQAIDWLKEVQKGNIIPDLPAPTDENGDDQDMGRIKYGGMKQNKYDW